MFWYKSFSFWEPKLFCPNNSFSFSYYTKGGQNDFLRNKTAINPLN